MRHILVHRETKQIANIIEYDPAHPYDPPEGHDLISVAHNPPHDIGWHWDGEKGIDPNPPKKRRGTLSRIGPAPKPKPKPQRKRHVIG